MEAQGGCLGQLKFMLMTHCGMLVTCSAGFIRLAIVLFFLYIYFTILYEINTKRYLCGLWWNFKAVASERELATALFSPESTIGSSSRRFSKDSDIPQNVKSETDLGFVLDRIFEGVCRPFKVRVEQVLQSQPGLLLAYKLNHLLGFYRFTVEYFVTLSVFLKPVHCLYTMSLLYLGCILFFFRYLSF